ncbi:MAG: hypothetical protein AAF806_28540 [Bacteroidota bacterium]
MKNKPTKYGNIQKPCTMNWKAMRSIKDSNERFCLHCKKEVRDISKLSEAEILDTLSEDDLCIRATTRQVNVPFQAIKRFGKLGVLLFGLFAGHHSSAQMFLEKPDYTFEQSEIKSDTILLKGIVKGEKKLRIRPLRMERTTGYKRLQNVTISIFSEEGFLIAGAYPYQNGKFEITVDRKLLGENFTIRVDDKSDKDYYMIEVNDLEPKDTSFEFFMKERMYVMGRFL